MPHAARPAPDRLRSQRRRNNRTVIAQGVAAALTLAVATGAVVRENRGPDCRTGLLPDRACTPGQVLTSSKPKVCTAGYAQTVRNVTSTTRRKVIERYDYSPIGEFEIDHLVPLSLGGSNDVTNLWPEPAPAFRVKDRLEFATWRAVCDGRLKLRDVQRQFARDWTTVKVPALPTPQVTIP